jgi:hypothetical protein
MTLSNKLYLDVEWCKDILSILVTDTPRFEITDKGYLTKLNDEDILIDMKKGEALFHPTDKITIPTGILTIVKTETETTIGRALQNAILLEYALEGRVPFINKQHTPIDIYEDHIASSLVPDDKDGPGKITITLYKRFLGVSETLAQLSEFVVVPVSEKSMTEPKGIKAFKNRLLKEFKDAYGKDFLDNDIRRLEFEERLKAFDKEHMQDDPTFGIAVTKKILNTSRKSKYLSIGKPAKLAPDANPPYVLNSLKDGMPKSKEELAGLYNAVRSGSFSRGAETMWSGLMFKLIAAATRSFRVGMDDCKTNKTLELKITKYNAKFIVDRYILLNGKIHRVTADDNFIGKTVSLRDPLHCKSKGDTFCKVCLGDRLSELEFGITLPAISIGGAALSASLSKFHAITKTLKKLTTDDLIQ